MYKQSNDRGVSPVIGVILLVALTVALVALAATVVFDISSETGDAGTAALDYDEDANTLTVVDNGTADSITAIDGDENEKELDDGVGTYDLDEFGDDEDPDSIEGEFDVIMEVNGDDQLYGSFETNEE